MTHDQCLRLHVAMLVLECGMLLLPNSLVPPGA